MKAFAREFAAFGPRTFGGERVPVGPAGTLVEIDTEQVATLGRFMSHGDAIPRIVARLADGRTVQLMHQDNDRDVRNWLRREMKRVPYPHTSRDIGWSTAWGEKAR